MAAAPLTILLLGTLEVRDDAGRRVLFRGTKSGALLAYLALQPGKALSREAIADALWEEGDSETLRNRLRQELSALRKQLKEAGIAPELLLDTPRDTAQVRAEGVTTDVAQYGQALTKAKRESDTAAREKYLSDAVTLYCGPLLSDFDEVWILTEREALAMQHAEALRELATLRQSRGDLSGAEESLRALLALDPMREEAHADLMRLYATMGEPTRVLKQYRELERVLREDFDVAPSEATRRLVEALREQAAVNGQRITPSVPAALPSAPFSVGIASETPSPPGLITTPESKQRFPSLLFLLFQRKAVIALLTICIVAAGGLWWNRLRTPKVWRLVWAKPYDAREGEKPDSEGRVVAADEEGNVYVCGFTQTDNEDVDILVLKYGPHGQPAWDHVPRYSSPGRDCDRAFSMIVDKSGVFVAGETYVPDNALPGIKGGWRLVVLKYDRDTGAELWTSTFYDVVADDKDHRVILARDGHGGVYVGGTAVKTDGTPAMLLLRYNSKGQPLWHHIVETPGVSRLYHLAAYRDHAVIACGATQQPDSQTVSNNALVARVDVYGKEHWQLPITIADHNPGSDTAQRVTIDSQGNICVGGVADTLPPDQGIIQQALWLARVSPGGSLEWKRAYKTSDPQVDVAVLAADAKNDLYLCARSFMPNGEGEAVALCYDQAGKRRWVAHLGKQGKHSTSPKALCFLKDGPVVAGAAFLPISEGRATEKEDYFLQALAPDGAKRWSIAYDSGTDANDHLYAAIPYRDKASGGEVIYAVGQSRPSKRAHIMLVKFAP